MEIASAYGPLKAYHFLINEDLNEPCAFLEVIEDACTSVGQYFFFSQGKGLVC